MAIFDDLLTALNNKLHALGAFGLALRKADGTVAALLAGNANGAALVEIDTTTPNPQLPSTLGALAKALSLSVCLASDSLLAPPTKGAAITPSDSTDLATIAPIGITIGVGGTLVARFVGAPSTDITMTVQAGQFVYGQFSRVKAATTATGIVGWAP